MQSNTQRFRYFIWFFYINAFFTIYPLHAKNKDTKDEKDSENTDEIYNYRSEINGSFQYKMEQGSLQHPKTATASKTKSNLIAYRLSYGFIVNDFSEPFVEYEGKTSTLAVDKYTNTSTVSNYGLGILFNLPMGGSYSRIKEHKLASLDTPKFSNASFIPYGGIVFASDSGTNSEGIGTKLQSSSGNVASKIILGFRVIPYPHISMNMSMRLSYQTTINTVQADESLGGVTSQMIVETDLLSLSLLF